MVVKELISSKIRALTLSDTVDRAQKLMLALKVPDLPLVEKEWVVGQIFEESLEEHKPNTKIEKVYFDAVQPLLAIDHVFSTISRLEHQSIESIPVVDQEGKYIGIVLKQDLLLAIQKFLNFAENGAVIVLKLPTKAYSLVEVARLIEENNVRILASALSTSPDQEHFLTLKLNTQQIGLILATLERFGYEIFDAFNHEPFDTQEKLRLDNLMKYLSI